MNMQVNPVPHREIDHRKHKFRQKLDAGRVAAKLNGNPNGQIVCSMNPQPETEAMAESNHNPDLALDADVQEDRAFGVHPAETQDLVSATADKNPNSAMLAEAHRVASPAYEQQSATRTLAPNKSQPESTETRRIDLVR